MKNSSIFIFAALLGFACASIDRRLEEDKKLRDIFSDMLNNTINGIVQSMSDPLKIKDISIKFKDSELLSGGANVTKVSLLGISSLVAPFIKVDILGLKLSMEILLTDILLAFDYWLDILIADVLPFYGSGTNTVTLDNISLNVTGRVNMTGGMHVQNLTVGLQIEKANFNLNGLIDNPEFNSLLNTILNDNFCDFIRNSSELISSLLSSIVENVINSALKPKNDLIETSLKNIALADRRLR
ncbi:uncharacterized protein [Leptinotarsa decemlineata]|uniref:uncharacterized protein n=1 Tax=Leptinotarsa decemlineata TaxID=7539 RepID=UPI003D30946E